MLSKELLRVLACPVCKSPVVESGDFLFCSNAECRRKYKVQDGIPVMLADEAEICDPAEFNRVVHS